MAPISVVWKRRRKKFKAQDWRQAVLAAYGKQRPWVVVPSYWAHQFQLILGDYFKVYPYAAEISEQATVLIGWINNHRKVRVIFDIAQEELTPDGVGRVLILAYLVANLARWTTHCIAFPILQEYLQFAVSRNRAANIAAQVGTAQYTGAANLREEAEYYCDLIPSPEFWHGPLLSLTSNPSVMGQILIRRTRPALTRWY
ncbi:hypothetical protein K438DRAFT_1975604 [Mycena galopus ATCC 62051]|nr:hypothetical protein K438DRAFT_1975604 [Mycena galopus ATCC 62051]